MRKTKGKEKKKESKRSRDPLAALKPELNLKTRYEEISDMNSYMNKLNAKEKAWLNKFSSEYVNASLDTENPKNNLHNTKELMKSCTDRNNSRNRCILSRANASGMSVDLSGVMKKELGIEEDYEQQDLYSVSKKDKKN
jgi:hypothetical protein